MNPGEHFGGGEPGLEDISSWQRKSHYARLGLAPGATPEQVKKSISTVVD